MPPPTRAAAQCARWVRAAVIEVIGDSIFADIETADCGHDLFEELEADCWPNAPARPAARSNASSFLPGCGDGIRSTFPDRSTEPLARPEPFVAGTGAGRVRRPWLPTSMHGKQALTE
jgi:hypothetical protein